MSKKIKVVQFTDAYLPIVDGVIKVVQNYCNKFNEVGCCELVACSAPKKSKWVDKEKFRVIRVKSLRVPEGYRYPLPFLDFKNTKYLKKGEFDIFHAHTPFSLGKLAVNVAKKRKIPVVATLHTQYKLDFERILGKNNKLLVNFMMWYVMRVYKQADSVWTVSETSKKVLRDYGFKGEIEVVRNATDYVYPQNAGELVEKINNLHSLKDQPNVFLFVGRMAIYKNLLLLCDALKIVSDSGADFKMLFVGDGFDCDKIKKHVKQLGIDKKCIFVGNVSDRELIQGYYLRADLLLFPSVFDMASIVQVEASAHKTPALVVKGTCAQEQIIDNENGFVSEENSVAYAQKIIEIIKNPTIMQSAGQKAYDTMYRTWEDVANEVVEKYQKVISEYNGKNK